MSSGQTTIQDKANHHISQLDKEVIIIYTYLCRK